MLSTFFRGANLLVVNADGNMPYDICEDDTTLDYIENEMQNRGVTQKLIDDTRALTELTMLRDLRETKGIDLEYRDENNATPVSNFPSHIKKFYLILFRNFKLLFPSQNYLRVFKYDNGFTWFLN